MKLPLRKKGTAWKGLPSKVRSGEDTVPIRIVNGYIDGDSKYRTLGGWDEKDGITLSTMMTRKQAQITLWHEVLHEALEQAGVKSEKVEAFIDAIDDQSLDILQRNPKLRRFLFND